MPEPEDVRKEVWGTLAAVSFHANIAKNNCYRFYEPRMERDGDIEVGMGFRTWELKETAPLKNKWRKYTPAEPQPVPTAQDSFIVPDDSGKELELEPLKGLDTSLDESNDETVNGDKGKTSCAGKQKRERQERFRSKAREDSE